MPCQHASKVSVPSYHHDTEWCPDCGAVRGSNGIFGPFHEFLEWQLPRGERNVLSNYHRLNCFSCGMRHPGRGLDWGGIELLSIVHSRHMFAGIYQLYQCVDDTSGGCWELQFFVRTDQPIYLHWLWLHASHDLGVCDEYGRRVTGLCDCGRIGNCEKCNGRGYILGPDPVT